MPSITVGDTGGLISLAIPVVAPEYHHGDNVEPFGLFLTNYDVTIPQTIFDELYGLASEADETLLGNGESPPKPDSDRLVAAAAAVVTKAEGNGYEVREPYAGEEGHDDPPDWDLDGGETAAIVQANGIEADAMVSDDFKSKTAILRRLNETTEWLSSFDVLVEMSEGGLVSKREGQAVAEVIVNARNWEEQPYVQKTILRRL
ncbi:hypothetical protein [Halorussus ruber]|uniref:hypothetical protein n=1 Tax=Halorussus ruber TaxID=1126238 RepID=UPI0010925F3B|nr:hypothetical protein [Halorussus ruber]